MVLDKLNNFANEQISNGMLIFLKNIRKESKLMKMSLPNLNTISKFFSKILL